MVTYRRVEMSKRANIVVGNKKLKDLLWSGDR